MTTIAEDLMTIIDFCNEIRASEESNLGDKWYDMTSLAEAHDIAHVLMGGDSVVSPPYGSDTKWHFSKIMCKEEDGDLWGHTDAWPDVRRRMADVITKAEGMLP